MRLTVLVDNNPAPGLYSAWGLSILADLGSLRILFDGGPDPRVLRHNAAKLGIDLRSVDLLFLSHGHADHFGGFLETPELSGKTVIIPPGADGALRRALEAAGLSVSHSIALEGLRSIWFPDPIPEQSLLIEAKRVLLTGCSHPGILRIAEKALEEAGALDLVMGGFHLAFADRRKVEEILEELLFMEIGRIAPLHCSGNYLRNLLSEHPERSLLLRVGSSVEV